MSQVILWVEPRWIRVSCRPEKFLLNTKEMVRLRSPNAFQGLHDHGNGLCPMGTGHGAQVLSLHRHPACQSRVKTMKDRYSLTVVMVQHDLNL
ncbi:MAG: hypothetical protein R6U20_02695, partial [Longimonas sp.]